MATIIILDNNLDNFTIWTQDVLQHVSRPKFGIHADHLLLQDVAPTFRDRPHIDDTNDFNEYRYEHQVDNTITANPNPPTGLDPFTVTTPPGIPGRPTVIGEQFFREDMKIFHADLEKFQKQGIELFELLFSRLSTSSKLLAKTQPEYADAIRNCCPHALFRLLSISHQTSSATRSLAAIVNFLNIRQTSETHPELVDRINTAYCQVQSSWDSVAHPGYIKEIWVRGQESLFDGLVSICFQCQEIGRGVEIGGFDISWMSN